jgi:ABC-type glycerol-3-phosphate transport system permease component
MATAAAEVRGPAVVGESVAAKILRVVGKAPVHFILVLVGLLWLVPTLGLFLTSLFTPTDVNSLGWWEIFTKPSLGTFENYQEIWKDESIRSAGSRSGGRSCRSSSPPSLAMLSPGSTSRAATGSSSS